MFTDKEKLAFSAILRAVAYGEQSYPSGMLLGILMNASDQFSISPEISNQSANLTPQETFLILQNMSYEKRKTVYEWINKMASNDTVGSFRYRLAQNVKEQVLHL